MLLFVRYVRISFLLSFVLVLVFLLFMIIIISTTYSPLRNPKL